MLIRDYFVTAILVMDYRRPKFAFVLLNTILNKELSYNLATF